MRQILDRGPALVLAIALGLLLPAARPGLAQDVGPPGDGPLSRRQGATGVINTHAEAHRRLPNTVSDASVGIEVHARDVSGATALLARQSQGLLNYLRTEKVERLRTEGVSVEPEMQEVHGHPDRITGHTGRTTVTFRTTPDRLPVLLAGCLGHGANSASQAGSSPREEEIEQARQELSAEAARSALAQAGTVARAIGARVTGVLQVDVDPSGGDAMPGMRPAMAMHAARPGAAVPVEAGEADIQVQVQVKAGIVPQE